VSVFFINSDISSGNYSHLYLNEIYVELLFLNNYKHGCTFNKLCDYLRHQYEAAVFTR